MKKEKLLQLLDTLGMRPGRGLGQNFLLDSNLPNYIARQGNPQSGDIVLEVGPGFGALSRELLTLGAEVFAVEFDHRIAAHLRSTLTDEHFHLIEGDACKVDFFSVLPPDKPYRTIANLPYAISSVFIARMLAAERRPEKMVFLLQKEMAQRLAAPSGCSDYGALSVRAQLLYDVKILRLVPPDVFFPKPEVESAIAAFEEKEQLPSPRILRYLPGLVKNAFSQRRKQLGKVLGRLYGPEKTAAAFAALGIPHEIRPERLTPEQFLRLTEIFFAEEEQE